MTLPDSTQMPLPGMPVPGSPAAQGRVSKGRWLTAASTAGHALVTSPTLVAAIERALAGAVRGTRGIGTSTENRLAEELDAATTAQVEAEVKAALGTLPHVGRVRRVVLERRGGDHPSDWILRLTGSRSPLAIAVNLKTKTPGRTTAPGDIGSSAGVLLAALGLDPDDSLPASPAALTVGIADGTVKLGPGEYGLLVVKAEERDGEWVLAAPPEWIGLLATEYPEVGGYTWWTNVTRPGTLSCRTFKGHPIGPGFDVRGSLVQALLPRNLDVPLALLTLAGGDVERARRMAEALDGVE